MCGTYLGGECQCHVRCSKNSCCTRVDSVVLKERRNNNQMICHQNLENQANAC